MRPAAMKTVSSRYNAWVKRLRSAIHDHEDEIAIEGPKQVLDAIARGWTPLAVIVRDGVAFPEGPHETIELAAETFDGVSATSTSQGVVGLFARPADRNVFADRDRAVVALDGVQDPGNVGTIVRLAAAFDCGGVVLLPGTADAFGPKAIRSSAGSVIGVPIARMTREALIAQTWPLFAATAVGAPADPPAGGGVIVLGSEGAGVSPAILAHATAISIPMSTRVESLNVASAAAILLARSFALRGT